jgi:hypothetical protein
MKHASVDDQIREVAYASDSPALEGRLLALADKVEDMQKRLDELIVEIRCQPMGDYGVELGEQVNTSRLLFMERLTGPWTWVKGYYE